MEIRIKVRFDYDTIKAKMQRKGIKTLRQLCFESGANYDTLKKNKQRGCISFVNAWLIAEYLECDIKEIVEPDWQN